MVQIASYATTSCSAQCPPHCKCLQIYHPWCIWRWLPSGLALAGPPGLPTVTFYHRPPRGFSSFQRPSPPPLLDALAAPRRPLLVRQRAAAIDDAAGGPPRVRRRGDGGALLREPLSIYRRHRRPLRRPRMAPVPPRSTPPPPPGAPDVVLDLILALGGSVTISHAA